VYDFIRKLSSGSDEVYALGDGSQIRDFTYVADVVRAALWVAQAGSLCGEVYNVASGEPCTIRELLDTLCELMDIQPHIAWSGNVRPGDPQRWLPSISRLKALGWQPTVHLREGLERTLSWYRSGQKPVFSEKTGF
jgi:nucleoside-diphosphate-sugar epimerase